MEDYQNKDENGLKIGKTLIIHNNKEDEAMKKIMIDFFKWKTII